MTLTAIAPANVVGEDRSRDALDLLHHLLQAPPEERSLPAVLGDLAEAFGAQGAGLATLDEAPAVRQVQVNGLMPVSFVWDTQPELLVQAKKTPGTVVADAAGASWLLTAVWPGTGEGWLLWMRDRSGRAWSEGERSALILAGQVLGRLKRFGSPAWGRFLERAHFQRRVDHAATVTGKLAHDFGNILTGILGFAELSLTHLPADSLPRRYLEEVCTSARDGADWLRKLQVFSRRNKPKGPPAPVPAVVADVETRYRSAWGNKVALLVSLPDDLPAVVTDAGSLRQLLEQLLQNAREAIPDQGVVTLSARIVELNQDECLELFGNACPGRHVEITITDTGTGMSADTRRRVLTELFHSTKTRQRGLGLAMAHGILRAYHGGLRFGPDPESGTAVRLFVPVALLAQRQSPEIYPVRSGGTLLVVDDDPLVVELVRRILEGAGYQVQTASGPVQALDYYRAAREPYRLVLSDMAMPVMNGLELARQVLAHDPAARFLFITSQASGCVGGDLAFKDFPFLKKPFEPAALVEAVARALAKSPHPLQERGVAVS